MHNADDIILISELEAEIERLELLVAKLNGGEELQTIMADNERLRAAILLCSGPCRIEYEQEAP